MLKKVVENNGNNIVIIQSDELLINDVQSALDLISTIDYYDNSHRVALYKESIIEDFFDLRTGLAGEILQKFVNYAMQIAIIGDFSVYSSKALRDFIYECNNGRHIYFVSNEQEAIEKLSVK